MICQYNNRIKKIKNKRTHQKKNNQIRFVDSNLYINFFPEAEDFYWSKKDQERKPKVYKKIGLSIAFCVIITFYSSFFVVAHILLAYNITGKILLWKRLA